MSTIPSWPPDTCSASPTLAHYMIEVEKVDSGVIFCCKYCQCYKWLPIWYDSVATMFSIDARRNGIQVAYQKLLTEHPVVVRALRRYGALDVSSKGSTEVLATVNSSGRA